MEGETYTLLEALGTDVEGSLNRLVEAIRRHGNTLTIWCDKYQGLHFSNQKIKEFVCNSDPSFVAVVVLGQCSVPCMEFSIDQDANFRSGQDGLANGSSET